MTDPLAIADAILLVCCVALSLCLGLCHAIVVDAPYPVANIQKQLDINTCGSSNPVFEVQRLEVNPFPVPSEKTVSIEISVKSSQVVSGGKVSVVVRRSGILSLFKLVNEEYDLCSAIPVSCPINPGSYTISVTKTVPHVPALLKGKFNVNVKITSDSKQELMCINLPLEVA